MNLVDLDGRRWVDRFGNVVYDSNGPTSYATSEQVELIMTMRSVPTGFQQLQKLADAPFDVQVRIDYATELTKEYGHAINTYKIYKGSGKYEVVNSEITIYAKAAEKRAMSLGLSANQAMAVNFGHEIEHTTKENIELSLSGASDDDVEAIPDHISQQMISEFLIKSPLPDILHYKIPISSK